MDFGSLLHVAKRNSIKDQKTESAKYYPAKFSAPKKESKEKKLSANIQKFLKNRDEEEREKARIAKQKLDDLMAMRDDKAKNKIKKMLKVTKSANKSVLADAVDNDNTAYTLQGPEQPDEDDYGYTSHEASELYKSLMDKYKTVPDEKKFSASRPSKKNDLMGTKDRVRAALLREQEEENGPHRRKRNTTTESISSSSKPDDERSIHRRKNLYDPETERREEEQKKREEQRAKAKNRGPPPALDFHQLLQLAEKKQFEPLEVEVEVKQKETERLLTKREKREMDERQRYFAEKEKRKHNRHHQEDGSKDVTKNSSLHESTKEPRKMEPNGRIPKIGSKPAAPSNLQKSNQDKRQQNGDSKNSSESRKISANNSHSQPKINRERNPGLESRKSTSNSLPSSPSSQSRQISANAKSLTKSPLVQQKPVPTSTQKPAPTSTQKPAPTSTQKPAPTSTPKSAPTSAHKPAPTSTHKTVSSCNFPPKDIRKPLTSKDGKSTITNRSVNRDYPPLDVKKASVMQNNNNTKTRPLPPQDVKTRQFPPPDVKTRKFPPDDIRPRQFPPSDRPRQFPPSDIRPRQFPPSDMRRPAPPKKPLKRRQVIDDDDSEYDSEMDDFIDDGPDEEDYSKHIKEIFGYDKSKYRGLDENVDNMESSFSQQMREEFVSKKIGLMEDLEDMRMEAEEKKRKKKRRKLSESD